MKMVLGADIDGGMFPAGAMLPGVDVVPVEIPNSMQPLWNEEH